MGEALELERLLPVSEKWIRDFYVKDDEAIRKFASENNDENPLHHDADVARRNGLKGICAPGLMLLKFINTSISDKFPEVAVCELTIRIMTPVYAKTWLFVICRVLRRGSRVAKIGILVQNGKEVVAEGSCLIRLPKPNRT